MYILNDFLFALDPRTICVQYKTKEQYKININVNPSLQEYLHKIKMEIDKHQSKWDQYKKVTNKYEFINTPCFVETPKIRSCVCSYKPISRSFFKMIEILKQFNFSFPTHMKSFHLAEGPGGFIEALAKYRNNPEDAYFGMTLMDRNHDIPRWNKIQSFMKQHENIHLVYGPKHDGNLYFRHNLDFIIKDHKNKYDFITADGGFDYSVDFNKQEEISVNLIFCEILYALILQKQDGCFILKIFDMFHEITVELIYLLCFFYKQVYIFKPHTSREANSEKYIVCKGYMQKKYHEEIIQRLCVGFHDLSKQKLQKLFLFQLNSYFLSKIQEINAIYGQQQVENILSTINHIQESSKNNKDKIDKIKMSNIEKCITWCKDHNQPIYEEVEQLLNC